MAGKRVYRKIKGEWVDITDGAPPREHKAPLIMEDIKPYKSTITDEWITSRSKHREHLRIHGCQEIGNEIPKFLKDKYEREHQRPVWRPDGRRYDV